MLIQPYTTDWVASFEKLKAELLAGLVGVKCELEHVGRTAVPGLAAGAAVPDRGRSGDPARLRGADAGDG